MDIRFVSADEAVSHISSHSHIHLSSVASVPHCLIRALCRRADRGEVTDLHFRPLSQKEIAKYVATGEPMDKAGAYGIQGGAALFCERMVGDYYNVMGLPVCRLGQTLRSVAPEVMEGVL